MDFHIINEWTLAIATAFAVLVFWAYRSLLSRISEAEKANAALALHVAEEYVSVKRFDSYIERFDKAMTTIFAKLDSMSERLDRKADRT